MELPEHISELLNNGIEVTIYTDKEKGICLNIGVCSKSYVVLYGENFDTIKTRYEDKGRKMTYGFNELLDEAEKAMCGRDYINIEWRNLLEKKGYNLEVNNEQ